MECDPRHLRDRPLQNHRPVSIVLGSKRVMRHSAVGPDIGSLPPRTTRKSYRPRVSDRTMVGNPQPLCLLRPEKSDVAGRSQ
jgi:hypothetical protein